VNLSKDVLRSPPYSPNAVVKTSATSRTICGLDRIGWFQLFTPVFFDRKKSKTKTKNWKWGFHLTARISIFAKSTLFLTKIAILLATKEKFCRLTLSKIQAMKNVLNTGFHPIRFYPSPNFCAAKSMAGLRYGKWKWMTSTAIAHLVNQREINMAASVLPHFNQLLTWMLFEKWNALRCWYLRPKSKKVNDQWRNFKGRMNRMDYPTSARRRSAIGRTWGASRNPRDSPAARAIIAEAVAMKGSEKLVLSPSAAMTNIATGLTTCSGYKIQKSGFIPTWQACTDPGTLKLGIRSEFNYSMRPRMPSITY